MIFLRKNNSTDLKEKQIFKQFKEQYPKNRLKCNSERIFTKKHPQKIYLMQSSMRTLQSNKKIRPKSCNQNKGNSMMTVTTVQTLGQPYQQFFYKYNTMNRIKRYDSLHSSSRVNDLKKQKVIKNIQEKQLNGVVNHIFKDYLLKNAISQAKQNSHPIHQEADLQKDTMKFIYEKLQIKSNKIKQKKINANIKQFHKGVLLKDRYQIIQKIGYGLSGYVYKSKDILSNRFVAIKHYTNEQTFFLEHKLYKNISHKNIVEYYATIEEENNKCIVFQYLPFNLHEYMKQHQFNYENDHEEQKIKRIFQKIVNGVSYLHGMGVAHRDIKLQNIMISEDGLDIKLIDFGLALEFQNRNSSLEIHEVPEDYIKHEKSKNICGTLHYMAPQVLLKRSNDPRKIDIYALGVVLYVLNFGKYPIKAKNEIELIQKMRCLRRIFYPINIDMNLKDLLERMLEKKQQKRIHFSDVMNHKWLKE